MPARLLCLPGTFGDPGRGVVEDVLEHGYDGIRVDVDPGNGHENHQRRRDQVFALRSTDALVVFLVGPGHIRMGWDELVQKSADFAVKLSDAGYADMTGSVKTEVGNEPDLAEKGPSGYDWKKNPRDMGKCFAECYQAIRERLPGMSVLSPSISNLDEDSLRYLEKMAPELPGGCGLAFHRYPAGRNFEDAHDGFEDRFEEMERLREIADGRQLWNTETGWAEQNRGYTLTPTQVADRLMREDAFFSSYQSQLAAWTTYQRNSAVVEEGDDHDARRLKTYGVLYPDGRWKPIGRRMREQRRLEAQGGA